MRDSSALVPNTQMKPPMLMLRPFDRSAQAAPCVTTFAKALGVIPTLSIASSAIEALSSSADSAIFPAAADGVTLLAPTDAAFTAALSSSGLTAAEIGDKVPPQLSSACKRQTHADVQGGTCSRMGEAVAAYPLNVLDTSERCTAELQLYASHMQAGNVHRMRGSLKDSHF